MLIKPSDQEYSNRRLISGKSHIDHRIRVQLHLSIEEYVILDFIRNHNLTSKETITFRNYYVNTGYIPKDVDAFIQHLKERKLIVWNKAEERVDVYDDWKDAFTGDFERLWKILKKGNKAGAKERFSKVVRKIGCDELEEKLIAYVKHCDTYGIFKKGLEVWLEPKKEHWNDPLVANQVKMSPNQPAKNTTQIRFKK